MFLPVLSIDGLWEVLSETLAARPAVTVTVVFGGKQIQLWLAEDTAS